ncbi:MAG: hypothetical protein A2504_05580 [Bdellovibrionales bacterium RIFOXYD12_FULL_39_22]|nr:MAG: hypothetical protein A2385_06245 [Bdellovibrionales bacterium RIFOXYB1_FULL_39_21]OFZ41879.1 MAG: hypothetical protein A2485_08215 [Bdellovibrionales bacterium RIFOXYC12_FULL_39_17]OFZ50595.1 MAG: hypothetical protein A2404_05165 [Bdellovibrionales bacterium RIFOXYC1_FULL_39_130]OFZ77818.1 MAG: hypothetical protein A2560_00335 [Bdellovibrionales bacterium RIFOXYD1_FULL_39_84]OFZ93746.1 MAG: hypothetical protein A2504_05580 [Bdellovibrionales bacterium RIFOXYD12_FULL_39_22]HLE11569.1 bi
MYQPPSRKRTKKAVTTPDLVPIMDGFFIIIFFLLMSATFTKLIEIASDVPIISDSTPPENKDKPLALTIKILPEKIQVLTGVPSALVKEFGKIAEEYDTFQLHEFLVNLKVSNQKEKTVILEPIANIEYEQLVKIMDTVRMLLSTDPAFYKKDKDNIDVRDDALFDNIIFGNIQG